MDLGLNDFTDLVEIGRGGFGMVFRAHQPAFGRTVALKVLTQADESTVRRFERERLALGPVSSHPNIVTVHDSGLTDTGLPFLAMEYMEGGSLEDNIVTKGPSAWQATVDIGIKLCGALETAHRAGITHRDLKPANVLLSRYNEPHLADFGIASIEGGEHTKSGAITASIHYAPPEVLDGRRPGVAGDVYGLGATLYSLLAGRAPFKATGDDTIVALALRVVSQTPPDLRPIGIPDDLATVIERSMSKAAENRYPSAESFGRALQQVQQNHGLRPTAMPIAGDAPDLANLTTRIAIPTPADPVSGATAYAPTPLPGVGHEDRRPATPKRPTSGPSKWPRIALVAAACVIAAAAGAALTSVLTDDGDGQAATSAIGDQDEAPADDAAPLGDGAPSDGGESPAESDTDAIGSEDAGSDEAGTDAEQPEGDGAGTEVEPPAGDGPAAEPEPEAPDVPTSDLAAGTWQEERPLVASRQQTNAVVTPSGRIWITGGLNPFGASLRSVESWDPATGWADCGCDLPVALNHHSTTLWQGAPVVLGGWVGDETVPSGGQPRLDIDVNQSVYRLGADGQWEPLAELPVPKVAAAAVTVGDRIVVVGGQDGGAGGGERALEDSTLVFDGERWTRGTPIPTPREHVAAATDGRFVYVIGGRPLPAGAAENLSTLERYDPATDEWVRLADMPTARSDLAAVWANGYLVALGGESATGTFDSVEIYDPENDTWASLPPLTPGRHGAAAVYYQSVIRVMGGAPEQGHNLSVNLVQTLGLDIGL